MTLAEAIKRPLFCGKSKEKATFFCFNLKDKVIKNTNLKDKVIKNARGKASLIIRQSKKKKVCIFPVGRKLTHIEYPDQLQRLSPGLGKALCRRKI